MNPLGQIRFLFSEWLNLISFFVFLNDIIYYDVAVQYISNHTGATSPASYNFWHF